LTDRFNKFQAEVRKLEQKPQGLEQELSNKQHKLERLASARASQLALEETANVR
jgi:cell division septum initiation protein DivIVA